MITFDQVELDDYGPYSHAVVDLNRPGLTLVEGDVRETAGFVSNGAGKSFIIDAIHTALYGKPLRSKFIGDKPIRRGTDGYRITLRMTLNGQPARIVCWRNRGGKGAGVSYYVGDADCSLGTTPATHELIARQVMDQRLFANTVAFGARADVAAFLEATDSERKDVLEKLVELDLFSRAEELAKDGMSKAHSDYTDAVAAKDNAEAAVIQLAEVTAVDPEELALASIASTHSKARLRNASRQEQAAAEAVTAAEEALAKVQSQHRMAESIHAKRVAAYEEERTAFMSKSADIQAQIRRAEQDKAAIAPRIAAIEALAEKPHCPTCAQTVGQEHVAMVVAGLRDLAASHGNRVTTLSLELTQHEQSKPTAPEPIDRRSIDSAQAVVETARGNHYEAKTATATAGANMRAAVAAHVALQERAGDSTRTVEDAKAAVVAAVEEAKRLELELNRWQFWTHGFGNQGIKSLLLEAELVEINRRCARYTAALMDEGTTIALTATKALKSGKSKEEIGIHVDIPGKAECYEGASTGQKRRMNLCVLLALRDLVASRSAGPCKQLFVDELFDGIDPAGVSAIVDLMRSLLGVGPIFLITHTDGLRSAADTLVTVTHHGEHATLVLTEP